MWPQYQAAKVALAFYHDTSSAAKQKKKFERGITCLEPFVESVPQVLILCNIYLKTTVIGTAISEVEVADAIDIFAGEPWVFFTTLSLSVLSASIGITKFFKSGPTYFLPPDTLISLKFILAFLATVTFLLFKGFSLATMIYSASTAMPHLLPKHSNTLLTSQPPCSAITMVKVFNTSWHNVRHINLVLLGDHSEWSSAAVYRPPGTQWVYLRHPATGQLVTQDGTADACLKDVSSCRPSLFSDSDFYCTNVTNMGALLWFLVFVLPTLLVNLVTITVTIRSKLIQTLILFPALFFSGNFSLFLFGPLKSVSSISCPFSKPERKLVLSTILTWANMTISVLQGTLAFIMLNQMKGELH